MKTSTGNSNAATTTDSTSVMPSASVPTVGAQLPAHELGEVVLICVTRWAFPSVRSELDVASDDDGQRVR